MTNQLIERNGRILTFTSCTTDSIYRCCPICYLLLHKADIWGFDYWLHCISTVDCWLRMYTEECIATSPLPYYMRSRCAVAAVTIESMGVTPPDKAMFNWKEI